MFTLVAKILQACCIIPLQCSSRFGVVASINLKLCLETPITLHQHGQCGKTKKSVNDDHNPLKERTHLRSVFHKSERILINACCYYLIEHSKY